MEVRDGLREKRNVHLWLLRPLTAGAGRMGEVELFLCQGVRCVEGMVSLV